MLASAPGQQGLLSTWHKGTALAGRQHYDRDQKILGAVVRSVGRVMLVLSRTDLADLGNALSSWSLHSLLSAKQGIKKIGGASWPGERGSLAALSSARAQSAIYSEGELKWKLVSFGVPRYPEPLILICVLGMVQKDADSPGELGEPTSDAPPQRECRETPPPRTLPSYPPFPSGRIKAIQPPWLLMVAVATARWEEQGGPDSDWSHSFQGSQCHPAWLFLQHFVGSSVGVKGWVCAGCSGTLPPSPSSPHSCCRGAQPGIPPIT